MARWVGAGLAVVGMGLSALVGYLVGGRTASVGSPVACEPGVAAAGRERVPPREVVARDDGELASQLDLALGTIQSLENELYGTSIWW